VENGIWWFEGSLRRYLDGGDDDFGGSSLGKRKSLSEIKLSGQTRQKDRRKVSGSDGSKADETRSETGGRTPQN